MANQYFELELRFEKYDDKPMIRLNRSRLLRQKINRATGESAGSVEDCTGSFINRNLKGIRGLTAFYLFWKITDQCQSQMRFCHQIYCPNLHEAKSRGGEKYSWVKELLGSEIELDSDIRVSRKISQFFNVTTTSLIPITDGIPGTANSEDRIIDIEDVRIILEDDIVTDPAELFKMYENIQTEDELESDRVTISGLRDLVKNYPGGDPEPPASDFNSDCRKAVSGGALDSQNQLYIKRHFESEIFTLLKDYGRTIALRGSRQCGKSSLFSRISSWQSPKKRKFIIVDFQSFDLSSSASSASLFRWFADAIISKGSFDISIEWDNHRTAKQSLTNTMQEILRKYNHGITLLIDEPDRLFRNDVLCSEFFSLLRFWHNQRAFDPDSWAKLDLIFSYTSDPGLWIKDSNQSPFNVAYCIDIKDFIEEEIAELIDRYEQGLHKKLPILNKLREQTFGHPYLCQLILSLLAEENTFDHLLKISLQGQTQLGRYLRARFAPLHRDEELYKSMHSIFYEGQCDDYFAFESLWSMGLIRGDSRRSCELRCGLFRDYFQGEFL